MRISIDRKTITLENLARAKEIAKENAWIDSDTVKSAATAVLRRFHGTESVYIESLLSTGAAAVTLNHYVSLDVYFHDVSVQYTYYGADKKTHWCYAVLSFDMTDYLSNSDCSAFVQHYERTEYRCC